MRGTLRTFDPNDRIYLLNRTKEIMTHYSEAWRCSATFNFLGISYPTVRNDSDTFHQVQTILSNLGGLTEIEPSM